MRRREELLRVEIAAEKEAAKHSKWYTAKGWEPLSVGLKRRLNSYLSDVVTGECGIFE